MGKCLSIQRQEIDLASLEHTVQPRRHKVFHRKVDKSVNRTAQDVFSSRAKQELPKPRFARHMQRHF